jgi:hypothetical protein
MKYILIAVWFAFPQQQQQPDFSSIAWRQPLGVTMQEFDDKETCEAQAKRLAGPYTDAICSPKGNPDGKPTLR